MAACQLVGLKTSAQNLSSKLGFYLLSEDSKRELTRAIRPRNKRQMVWPWISPRNNQPITCNECDNQMTTSIVVTCQQARSTATKQTLLIKAKKRHVILNDKIPALISIELYHILLYWLCVFVSKLFI